MKWLSVKFHALFARNFPVLYSLRHIVRIFNYGYGHLKSVQRGYPVNASGHAIPWFSYPAIEFITQFDMQEMTVFEFGAGQSTFLGRKS
jgi:hypothetical protein